MSCLKKILCGERVIIGIRDYNNCSAPESNLFINDIPGITLKNASQVANEEQSSGYALLQALTKRAVQINFEEFYARMSPAFAFSAISEMRKLNYFDGTVLPVSAQGRGLVLKRWRSEMAQILVEEIYGKSATDGDGTITITDGEITKTYPITFVANKQVTVRIDYVCVSEVVTITCDNTAFQMYSGPISSNYTGCQGCGGNQRGFFITGWNGTAEEAKYFGLGVLASVRCFEENVICRLMQRMYFIHWYRAGMLYYEELLTSNRLNPITLFMKDQAQKNLDYLTKKHRDAFENFMPTIDAFLKSTKGECFTCNPSIKYVNNVSV